MTHHTASTRDTALIIRQLKGAPATILLMMLGIGRPTGRNELALLTTYSEHTVQKSLDQLQFIGLAQQHARRNGWALTSAVRQQLLAFPTPASQLDADPPEVHALPRMLGGSCLEGQRLPLDTPDALPAPAPEVHALPRMLGGSCLEGQRLHLDPGASPPASPPPADAEVHALPCMLGGRCLEGQRLHLSTPNSTGEVHALPQMLGGSCLEGQRLHLASSSSSSCSESFSPLRKIPKQLQQQPTPSDANPPDRPGACLDRVEVDVDALNAVALLTATGCPRHLASGKGAGDAVQVALAGGWTGAEIYDHIEGWFDYVEHTEGIKHKGLFTAARIRNLEPAPPPRPKTADDYIAEALDRIVRH